MAEETAPVTIELPRDEALVLFELLHRWEDENSVGGPLEQGEQIALWALSGLLERELGEPFREDYGERIGAARARLDRQDLTRRPRADAEAD